MALIVSTPPASSPIAGEGRAQGVEGLAHRYRETLAGLGQAHLARHAQEQRRADPLLEQLDLIADRRLGHAQLLAGTGEAAEPGRGLEGADGRERRQAGDGSDIS